MDDDKKIIQGSDNVYKDLGFEKPKEMLKKATIAFAIYENIIELTGITPLSLHQIGVGHFTGYSVKKLNKILQVLKDANK